MSDKEMEQAEKEARLKALKAQADLLGVVYSANIGEETLSKRIASFKANQGIQLDYDEGSPTLELEESSDLTDEQKALIGGRSIQELELAYKIAHAKALVRISISCVNPAKNDLEGDTWTIYSSTLGKISMWVPYQAPNGYHVPRCIAEFLKGKTYLAYKKVKVDNSVGGVDKEHYEVPEFVIRDLPPLSFEEFKRIAERQDRAESVRVEE